MSEQAVARACKAQQSTLRIPPSPPYLSDPHKGANWASAWRDPYWGQFYSLSYLGLARGSALAGDAPIAKKAFQDFFELWKDADPDIPILKQAKADYAKVK